MENELGFWKEVFFCAPLSMVQRSTHLSKKKIKMKRKLPRRFLRNADVIFDFKAKHYLNNLKKGKVIKTNVIKGKIYGSGEMILFFRDRLDRTGHIAAPAHARVLGIHRLAIAP